MYASSKSVGPARSSACNRSDNHGDDRQRKEQAQEISVFAPRAGSTGPVYDMGID